MKIRGIYVLSQKSVKRLIAATATAFVSICVSAASPEDMALASRFANAALLLMSLKCTLAASAATRAAVPDFMYLESKSLYLMMRPAEAMASHLAKPSPPPPVVSSSVPSVTADDRRMLRHIHRAAVFGETPTEAQVAGDVRRRQVLYGAELYRPASRYVKGMSSCVAAEKAIRAPQFSDVEGAYGLPEKESLARAIRRERASSRWISRT